MRKPKVKPIENDGNIFNLLGLCTKALRKIGGHAEAVQLQKMIAMSSTWEEAMMILLEYCEIE